MNPEIVSFSLPQGAVQKGQIYNILQPDYLSEDLMEIDLPTGLTIDVGWYPEGDPQGAFRVTLYRDYLRNRIGEPFTTRSVMELVRYVETLAARFSEAIVNCANSGGETVVKILGGTQQLLITEAVAA